MSVRPVALTLTIVGVVAALALGLALGLPGRDAVLIVAATLAGSVVTAGVGALVLARWSRRALRGQILVAALAGSGAVVGGVIAAAVTMFLSAHDLEVLLVVLVAAGGVSVAAAAELGGQVARASERLVMLARGIGDDDDGTAPAAPVAGGDELARVEAELHDVSVRLAESRRREHALDQSRRELVAWVSHDLRSPLASVRAMAEALEDGVVADPVDVDRYHRTIREESERLSALVDDLFELSRITSGALQLRRVPVVLDDVLDDAVARLGPAAEVRGVRLQRAGHPACEVIASPAELGRVLQNLLDNAIRHTPPGGDVRIETEVLDDAVKVSVWDACGGIKAEELDRVFDVAFRGDAARRRDQGGGGLGLAIAKGLVEAHAGSIDVANHPDGCRFSVRLPLGVS